MKIEKINENKIKVLIDDREAKEWNISFKNISENTPEVQEMFWTAIRLAEKDVDFAVDGAKLFVEAVPGSAEGFGMLITRVCSEDELSAAISSCGYKGRIRQSELRLGRRRSGRKYIYCFADFEALCAAAKGIQGLYAGDSALYKCQENFYLCMMPEQASDIWDAETLLLEFGSRVPNTQFAYGWLGEHGEQMIPEQAAEILQEYFSVS